MNAEAMKQRTMDFALRILKLAKALPKDAAGQSIGRQLLRAGTSVGANYRAACRARSRADFVAKLGIVEEEADETLFWLELLERAEIVPGRRLKPLADEGNEILSIVVASRKTARRRATRKRQSPIGNQESEWE